MIGRITETITRILHEDEFGKPSPSSAKPFPRQEPDMTEITKELCRPIIGIENRTAQEAFDIMADRIRAALPFLSSPGKDGGQEVEAVAVPAGCQLVRTEDLEFCVTAIAKLQEHKARLRLEQMISSAPSPQSAVDVDAVIERCALMAEEKAKECRHASWNTALKAIANDIRALKAKSPSSDRAASEGKL